MSIALVMPFAVLLNCIFLNILPEPSSNIFIETLLRSLLLILKLITSDTGLGNKRIAFSKVVLAASGTTSLLTIAGVPFLAAAFWLTGNINTGVSVAVMVSLPFIVATVCRSIASLPGFGVYILACAALPRSKVYWAVLPFSSPIITA